MNIKRIGAGNRMSEAVIYGGKVYLSGFVAEATKGKSVKEQTADVLNQIDATLKQAGSNKTLILKANIWLTSIATFAQMNEAWDAWVVAGETPARATVESKLAAPGLDVEIMVEAAIEGDEEELPARGARQAADGRSDADRAARKAARQAARKAGKADGDQAAKKAARKAGKAGGDRAAKKAARK